jgi:hypothetical protein
MNDDIYLSLCVDALLLLHDPPLEPLDISDGQTGGRGSVVLLLLFGFANQFATGQDWRSDTAPVIQRLLVSHGLFQPLSGIVGQLLRLLELGPHLGHFLAALTLLVLGFLQLRLEQGHLAALLAKRPRRLVQPRLHLLQLALELLHLLLQLFPIRLPLLRLSLQYKSEAKFVSIHSILFLKDLLFHCYLQLAFSLR